MLVVLETMNKRWRTWPVRLAELMLVIAVVVAVRTYMLRDAASGAAPPIEGALVGGRSTSLEALRGRPVLVHFWATWCPVCRLEEGNIQSIAGDHAVLTVALQSGGGKAVAAYLAAQGLSIPVVLDDDGTIAARYGVRGVPASFILDGQGRIRFVEAGYTTEAGLRFRLWLAGLLGGYETSGKGLSVSMARLVSGTTSGVGGQRLGRRPPRPPGNGGTSQ